MVENPGSGELVPINGSYAIGATLIIAFVKIYMTPKHPHTEPNIAIVFENGHLSAPSFPDAAVNNDVLDGAVFTAPPLYGIL